MSSPWGPALDAELAYRHQQARNDFRRGWTWRRKPATHVRAKELPVLQVAATAATHRRPAQQFPPQRVSAPLIPTQPRPNDEVTASGKPPLMPLDGGRVIAAVGGG